MIFFVSCTLFFILSLFCLILIQSFLLSSSYYLHGISFPILVLSTYLVFSYKVSLLQKAYSWIVLFLIHSSSFYLLIEEFNTLIFEVITHKEDLLMSFCYLLSICFYRFRVPCFSHDCLLLCLANFFVVKDLNSFLISFYVYSISIFLVVTVQTMFSILRLQHLNLNCYKLNFDNMQRLCSLQPYLHFFSVVDVTNQIFIYVLWCVQKHTNNF